MSSDPGKPKLYLAQLVLASILAAVIGIVAAASMAGTNGAWAGILVTALGAGGLVLAAVLQGRR